MRDANQGQRSFLDVFWGVPRARSEVSRRTTREERDPDDSDRRKARGVHRRCVRMEQNVLRMLDGMIGTTSDPQMKRALERHKKQTERQAERLEECLSEHGASPSAVKEVGGVMAALMKGVVDVARGDKAGRNARDGFATEHMEIASYQ